MSIKRCAAWVGLTGILLIGLACAPGESRSGEGAAVVARAPGAGVAPAGAAKRTSSAPAAKAVSRADKWENEIRKFEEADRVNSPAAGAVLFIGSSSIRMWKDVAGDFPQTKVINRGFGGSCVADATKYIDRIVAPYRPRMVVLYAGDNDIAGGRTARQVFEDYREFVRQVRQRMPDVPIAFISIKPSPRRIAFIEVTREANALIRDYAAQHRGLSYIDVFTPMLGADGRPRPELFGPDGLHMNRKGYDVWKTAVGPFLK